MTTCSANEIPQSSLTMFCPRMVLRMVRRVRECMQGIRLLYTVACLKPRGSEGRGKKQKNLHRSVNSGSLNVLQNA